MHPSDRQVAGVVAGARRRFCLLLAAAIGVARLPIAPALADDPPPRETIVVFGDSQAQGIAGGLQRTLLEDPRFKILNRTHPGAALVHAENEWLQPVRQFVGREKADIAIVMFGANDRLDIHDGDTDVRFRTDPWRAVYSSRADQILSLLTTAGMKVIWCGNPIARSDTYSTDMSYINDILQEQTERFGGRFLPLWQVIVDDSGHYVAYSKDRDGVTRRMRTDDGIHFTSAGYELIADKIVSALPQGDAKTP